MAKLFHKMHNIIMYCIFITSICSMHHASTQEMSSVSHSNETLDGTSSCTNIPGNADSCITTSDIPPTTEEEMSAEMSTTDTEIELTVGLSVESTSPMIETTAQPENTTTLVSFSIETNKSNSTEKPESTTLAIETTSASSTTIQMSSVPTHISEDLCSCDLTLKMCDVNCCCDPECSASDRAAFSSCYKKPTYPVDPRFCYHTHFIYQNNTELKMIELKDDLFCIVKENLHTDVNYQNRNPIVSLEELDHLLSISKTYSWPSSAVRTPEFVTVRSHRVGEIVWGLKDSSLAPLEIPISVAGGLCQASKVVQYLRDFASSCSQISLSATDCEMQPSFDSASYYRNLTIVAMSDQYNETAETFTPEQCVNSSCILVSPFLCPWAESGPADQDQCTSVTAMLSPSFHNLTSTCRNVVRHVRYVIHHNGTEGIINVAALITLSNISFSNSSQEQFIQSFGVEFVWASAVKTAFKRSGRPGYIVGKPVIAGRKVSHVSKKENSVTTEAIELSYDSNGWLGFPAVTKQGMCVSYDRQSVTFGENRRSTCLLPLRKSNFTSLNSCALIQKYLIELLAGDAINNVSETKNFNLFVATFGDSLVEETGDWVRVVLESIPSTVTAYSSKHDNRMLICKSLVTSLHMDIVFANVGALANPQAKILGVAFRFGPVKDFVFDCSPVQCSTISDETIKFFPVVNTVSYVDATKPAVPHFLEPPVYEIKLPHDFFYPFYSGSIVPKLDYLVIVWTLITILITSSEFTP